MKTVTVKFYQGLGQSKDYHYGYDLPEDVAAGDKVIVDSPSSGLTIVDVVAVSDGEKAAVTKFVVDRVDLTHYEAAKAKAARRAELKAQLDKASKKINEIAAYQLLVHLNPDLKDLVDEFAELSK